MDMTLFFLLVANAKVAGDLPAGLPRFLSRLYQEFTQLFLLLLFDVVIVVLVLLNYTFSNIFFTIKSVSAGTLDILRETRWKKPAALPVPLV